MDLPTYTNIWRIEKRLYKLYDFRLPMPLPINWIAVFAGITIPYIILLIAIGLPFNHTLVWLYVLPPGLLTWLTTRPVIENKRLPELVESQLRYLSEPRTYVRLAPLSEKDQMMLTARVWRSRPPRRSKAAAPAAARSAARPAPARLALPASEASRQVQPLRTGPVLRPTSVFRPERAADVAGPGLVAPGQPAVQGRPGRPRPESGSPQRLRVHERSRTQDRPPLPAAARGGPWRPPLLPNARTVLPAPAPGADQEQLAAPANLFVPGGFLPGDPPGRQQRSDDAVHAMPDVAPPEPASGASGLFRPVPSVPVPPAAPPVPAMPVPPAAVYPDRRPPQAAVPPSSPPGARVSGALPALPELSHDGPRRRPDADGNQQPEQPAARGAWPAPAPGLAPPGPVRPAPVVPAGGPAPAVPAAPAAPAAPPVPAAPAAPVQQASAAPAPAPARPAPGRATPAPGPAMPASGSAAALDWPLPARPLRSVPWVPPVTAVPPGDSVPPGDPVAPGNPVPPGSAAPSGNTGSADATEDGDQAQAADRVAPPAAAPADAVAEATERPEVFDATETTGIADPVETAEPAEWPEAVPGSAETGLGLAAYADRTPDDAPAVDDAATVDGAEAADVAADADYPGTADEAGTAVASGAIETPAPAPPPAPAVEQVEDSVRQPVPTVERALSGPGRDRNVAWGGKVKIVTGNGSAQGPGARDQEALDRNRARLPVGEPKRILVLGCTTGAGQSVTALMAASMLASLREQPVAAVDLHDGTLARYRAPAAWLEELLAGRPPQHIRATRPDGLHPTPKPSPARLDVVASHEPLGDGDDIKLAVQLSRHYPLSVLDPGAAGLTRLLKITDQLVVVVPASADAAGALADTRDWLDNNGHADLAMQAVTVINGVSRRSLPDVERAESIARGRSRAIVRVPWDDMLPVAATGPTTLRPQTRVAYTALAGVLVAGLSAAPVRNK